MKKTLLLCSLLGVFMTSIWSQTASSLYQDGKIWFKIKDNYWGATTPAGGDNPLNLPLSHLPFLAKFSEAHQLTKLSKPFWAAQTSDVLQRTYLLEFSDYANADMLVKKLEEIPYVEYAEKVPLDQHFLTPNDPSYSSQWGLNIIGAPVAWNYFSTGSTIVVAVVDDAIERTHSDLSPNLWVNPGEVSGNNIDDDGNGYIDDINGWDVASNDNNPNPPSSGYDHGTHVAGIVSARGNNGVGVASIGFSCKLMCVKSTSSSSSVTNGYDGIVYAAANGANVINCSWGGSTYTTTGQNVINYAWSQGCIIVAAAGNDNVSTTFYPAGFNNVISVAATNSSDQKASFSNYGSWIDISAPGQNIYSTTINNTYGNKSGTSMASPMVAGLVGLMWSLNPGMTRTDLINCLYNNADNISSQNPGYPGQLGAGRINAANSMQCVSLTLNNPPVADFTANYTSVTAGGQVTYTDMSVYNPTSWSWSFPGGTPSSYNGQSPPAITYSTPGIYNASLTVTNSHGSDTETKTSYITVNAAGGCYAVNLPLPGTWTLSNYYTGSTVGADGWINGNNVYDDREKAMYFDMSAQPYNYMVQCYIAFGFAYSANPNKIVGVKVYDGTSGSPGAQIGSTYNLTMGQIMADVNNSYYTNVHFPTPITLPVSKRFFVSVDITALQWGSGVYDTLSIVSNSNGQSTGYPIWEKQSDLNWYQYGSSGSWNLNASLIMHPFLTNEPVNAQFTQSATTICSGESITFDATGSTYQDTLLWVFPGGNPQIVSENPNPTVYFNQAGTSNVIMYVVGGGCSELDSAQVTITINPTPNLSVTTPTNPICSGGSTTISASGASSYTWSPGTGLSGTTGSSVTANPTGTTTYNITGTTGSCSANTTIEIEVLDPPVGVFTTSADTISCGSSISFDGSASSHVDAFSWAFTNGSPTSSTASGETVTYNTPGSQQVSMIVTNNCGSDTTTYAVFVLNDCNTSGIDEHQTAITAYYQPAGEQVVFNFSNMPSGDVYSLQLINSLGQLLEIKNVPVSAGNMQYTVPVSGLATGVYYFRVYNTYMQHTIKFVKQ